ncbi:MAG: hypothetical protein OHK0039_16870 [Bacteroidia bacterium]
MKGAEKLLHTIADRQIRPQPRWRFQLVRGLRLLVFIASVGLGALAFSVILFSVQQTDFQLLQHLRHSRLELFLGLLPLFWIGLQVCFLLAAMILSRQSGRGYKFTWGRLAGWSIGLSILLGTAFFITGGGQRLERAFALRVSLYESVQDKKERMWSIPQQGFLAGIITDRADTVLQVRDFQGHTWSVTYATAFVAPIVRLDTGETIKLVGIMEGPAQFRADEIRPWGGPGQHNGRPHPLRP